MASNAPETCHARRMTPMVLVNEIGDAIDWFRTHLGFEPSYRQDDYAHLVLDDAAIRIMLAPPQMAQDDLNRQAVAYLDVTGLDALFDRHRDALLALPEGKLRPPFDQPYGQREFHVIYEKLLIFVGEPIP